MTEKPGTHTQKPALYWVFPLHRPQLFYPKKPLTNCLKILALQIIVYMMGQKPGVDSDAFNREAETGVSEFKATRPSEL